jgi:uncharacterized cupin superfamily protein
MEDAMARHPSIVHWTEIERPDTDTYPDDDELMSIGTSYARHFGFTRLGIHHERLPPGRRTSYPHAEGTQEEFVYVLEGHPDVWLDGVLHRLAPGDAVGFPPGTGLCHTFINNTEAEVNLLVVGERNRPGQPTPIYYAVNPGSNERIGERLWTDWPARPLGPHDGLPDKVRAWRQAASKPPQP